MVYYLATVEGDQPRVRPFGTAHIFEGRRYIQTGKVKLCSGQLAANPKAEICAFHQGKSFLSAAPLNLAGADGAPCRAYLIDWKTSEP